jgi:hypothetical protein
MRKRLTKIVVSLLVLVLVASFGVFPTVVASQTNQEKATDFMKNMSQIDLSKYAIKLTIDSEMDGAPLSNNNRQINYLVYELTSEYSTLLVDFNFENDIMTSCSMCALEGKQILTTKQYDNLLDAAKDFLKRYQEYTKIDSNNLYQMLNNVDSTKDATITTENTKLTIRNSDFGGVDQVQFRWVQVINGADYGALDVTFDKRDGAMTYLIDFRALYVFGDTSVNVSEEQAITLALEGLRSYSYDMPDGSVVKDFKVSRDGIVATLVTAPIDYELRPYWDIRMYLDEVYPGSVFGVTVFLWANTGEVASISNMASGGINYPNNTNTSDTTLPDNTLMFTLVAVAVVSVVALAVGLAVKKKHK